MLVLAVLDCQEYTIHVYLCPTVWKCLLFYLKEP